MQIAIMLYSSAGAKSLGGHTLERKEATATLKELLGNGFCLPSLVSLKENTRGKFDLILKGDCDSQALKQFIERKNLMVKEDAKKGYWIISSP